jgi:prepilin-type N-terminal cleavage/methylation domain-containing protein
LGAAFVKRRNREGDCGFTLVELLVVIGIIAILAAILIPTVIGAIRRGMISEARSVVTGIETALGSYYSDHSRFPHGNGAAGDYSYGGLGGTAANAELFNVLRSIDGPGNAGHQNNSRRILYFQAKEDNLDAGGNLIDPWDNPYEITVDTGHNNECNGVKGGYGVVKGRTVAVWSRGPDGEAGTADDIKSW